LTDRGPAASTGAALFFALLAATLVVATLVVRARTPDLVLEVTSIAPRELTVDGTQIAFFVRESDSRAEISIVDADERVVRTLAAPVALPADREVVQRWDGRDDAGRPAAKGRYRLRVRLPERDRNMIWPRRITVEPTPGDRDRTIGEAER
jgi:hypothetical protein